jgi:tetratricopeptide (TPR) repeat protein
VLLYYIGVVFFSNLSYNYALSLEKRGRWLDAIPFYEKAISIYPKDIAFLNDWEGFIFIDPGFPGIKKSFCKKQRERSSRGFLFVLRTESSGSASEWCGNSS